MNFGKTIQDLRKANNMTQEDLAARLGVTPTAVSKWENNNTLPDILMLCALADCFEVTADELLGRARQYRYAVIAAQSVELGNQVAAIAKEYGILARGIFTDFTQAKQAAEEDASIRYLVACFHNGWYGDASVPSLVCVAPTDREIVAGIRPVFEKYAD